MKESVCESCGQPRRAEPPSAPILYCPNCSLPRRVLHWDGEIYKCGHCHSWFNPATVNDPHFSHLFIQGGPAGFDPETGFECQDHPRGDAARQLRRAR